MMLTARAKLILVISILALLGLSLFGLFLGTVYIPASHVCRILCSPLGLASAEDIESWEQVIVLQVRLPRVIMAMCVGSSLAAAGLVMQGLFRNPLACPSIIGVTAGASLGAVISIYLGLAARAVWSLPALAFVFGVGTAFVVYRLATSRGQTSMSTLLLAGIAISSLNVAVTSFILSLALANYEIGKEIVFWTLGGLDRETWAQVKVALPVCLFVFALLPYYTRDLDALSLGELHAASIGVDVHRVRRRLLLLSSLITATAVAVAGSIGFVGLIVPHLLRLLLGPSHRTLLAGSLIGGALFLLGGDLLARTLIAPEEMRLGVITAAIGAPFFLFLLARKAKREGF